MRLADHLVFRNHFFLVTLSPPSVHRQFPIFLSETPFSCGHRATLATFKSGFLGEWSRGDRHTQKELP